MIVGVIAPPCCCSEPFVPELFVSRAVRSGIPAIAVVGRVARLPVMIAVIAGIALTTAVVSTISAMVIVGIIRPIGW
jgi:hypothetical protein